MHFLVSQKIMQRHFFSTLHPLSLVIFATATVVAFVLLHNSRFNFHCYTQREAIPTQKSTQKWHCNLSRLLAWKITKGIHSYKPASLNCPIGEVILRYGWGDVGSVICVVAMYAGKLGTQGSRGLGSELSPGQSVTTRPTSCSDTTFCMSNNKWMVPWGKYSKTSRNSNEVQKVLHRETCMCAGFNIDFIQYLPLLRLSHCLTRQARMGVCNTAVVWEWQ